MDRDLSGIFSAAPLVMPYPLLRPFASRLRALQTPLLHHAVLRPCSHPMELPSETALVIAPHPDDETFGCGGLIARKRAAGIDVTVVILTGGGQSKSSRRIPAPQLVEARRGEALKAAQILGVDSDHVHFLQAPDGSLATLAPPERAKLCAQLRNLMAVTGAGEVYVPHSQDRHPDHEAAYRIALDSLLVSGDAPLRRIQVYEYRVWLIWKRPMLKFTLRELRGAGRLDVSDVQSVKNEAIGAYQSQLPSMPPGFLPQFRAGEEYYWKAQSSGCPALQVSGHAAASGTR